MKLSHIALATSAVLFSAASTAHVNIENSCDVNLNGNMQYKDEVLTINTDSGKSITFNAGHQVFVNGKQLNLSSEEQAHAKAYYGAVQQAVPLAIDIAIDGLEIASEAMGEVFTELLGEDDSLVQDLDYLFADIRTQLDNKFFDADGGFVLDGSDIQYNGWAGNAWENQFEERVESLVAKAVGKLMISLGSQMLMGGDESEGTLARLENLDTTIEEKVELRAEALEFKAKDLCNIMQDADAAENALKYSHEELTELDIIKFSRENAE
ncbi:DUF2884 family protein [Alteromonas sediminis]|uniref:DUF2884 family protein n=1 Tax=Alteromonas sediminis TaxID=2259342 RepID=A0A3N5XZ11_9ALTE|nr:DUF2884 family protein [Alteromonas sediminis]RPJ66262.1 DUF2884 family protein [Alteromonas sediminis]